MNHTVTVTNKTGYPTDTEVIIDGKKLPLSHLMDVDINIRPDEIVVASVRLKVDNLEILGNLHEPKNTNPE